MDSTGDSDKQEKISLTDVHIDKFGKATEMQNGHMTLSQRAIQYFRKNLTLVAILTGVILGFTTGLIIRLFQPSEDVLLWIGEYNKNLFPAPVGFILVKSTTVRANFT